MTFTKALPMCSAFYSEEGNQARACEHLVSPERIRNKNGEREARVSACRHVFVSNEEGNQARAKKIIEILKIYAI